MKRDHRGRRLRTVAVIILGEGLFATLGLLPFPHVALWMRLLIVGAAVAMAIVGCYVALCEVEYDDSGRARLPEDFNIAWWERKA